MDSFKKYRKPPGFKSYKISKIEGSAAPWRLDFNVDGESVGGGQFHTHRQAEEAGVDFMFSGWGDGA
jgi:hypothetical protein